MSSVAMVTVVRVINCGLWSAFPSGGVLLPCGVSGADGGGGDAHPAGARQSRAGEVPAVQGRLQRPEEGKG